MERLIVTGELLPGQPIRQVLMAERLGVSRLPIREALRQLAAAGLVDHEHNVGYTVARLQQSDFDQIYRMRAALEPEIIATLPRFTDEALTEVRRLGDLVVDAAKRGDLLAMRLHNHAFHFAIFEQSPLNLVITEIRRLWTLAMPYHAAYLYDPAARARVIAEHDQMIEALGRHDNDRLDELMNLHRQGGEASTGIMLRATRTTVRRPPDRQE
ncbi:GntR family transcriptional regulator [Nocardia carnea]|uniref:GntR family transcriptional regulator n=1 Tax=Nocardia carnea TaxID=37328 RepID=UPI0024568D86|nr:GntR family transcriptional regulator [Nocardia carnea]